ncbi:glycerone kinase [Singulisphaera acidiphila]|uniref:Dihydroxyacetone kinase, ATP-dependent/dihydroxyacetone kinase, DhaK subunit/dihydroxyacetone kinase, phosphoprotein-dependent, L subunit n=3 Tax=Singulisphaera acidiphila TaxID=466153 RepID=L0DGU5_SINAD|nr:glycerone kinase [Singulisphaera acidiphila]AGA28075.1 dihydroxyacetone kinase, ATP-dependent/dihydroxyacetone kinase, DhaK subunit/dihydroxyacetone kinase, phosphoprotein-dependent, L subunit [Singulisphaera acidiphila DSM 18658]
MKKLINRPEVAVEEMVEGLVATYPGLVRLPGQAVVVRSDAREERDRHVTLISGGGSGHEPAHAGYVGRGMLSAAVLGEVFTSPSPDAVLAAIRAVAGPPGVLLIVKNYTGDRLNFGLAAEMARAEGFDVEMVVVADDVALAATADNAGRRGLAGTILVHKIAGAAAEAGASLEQVTAEARAAAEAVGTMGVALTPCTVPAAGRPSFSLGDDEIELGLGIHGEPGVRREPLEPADDLVDHLINAILGDAPPAPGERVALLINNLGATPTMELLIVARCALATLESLGVQVERVYLGTFLSALEMAGVSLSVLRVDDARLARLDAATEAPAWPNAANRQRVPQAGGIQRGKAKKKPRSASEPPRTELGRALEHTILAAMVALIDAEPTLTELDRIVGDGDLGLSLERGARAVREALGTSSYPLDDPSATLQALGLTLQKALGGTSGALYALLFLRASARLRNLAPTDPKSWTDAFRAGTDAIGELGGSRLGDRTMLDALLPALEALEASLDASDTPTEALDAAAEAAEAGSEATARMSPRRGRSSYLGDRVLGHPDPGAVAVAVWLRAVASAL